MSLSARKQVSLTVTAKDLKNTDLFGKSDPICLCTVRNFGVNEPFRHVGSTEQIMNNLNPEWVTPFVLDWLEGEIQTVRFKLQDVDGHNKDGSIKGDPLGEVETTIETITKTAGRHGLTLQLSGDGHKPGSTITIFWEEVSPAVRGVLKLSLKGHGLKDLRTIGKSDPFFLIKKVRHDGRVVSVARSKVVNNNMNPVWPEVVIDLKHLCNGDAKRELELHVMDHQADDKQVEMGHQDVNITLETLMKVGNMFALKVPAGKSGSVGNVEVAAVQLVEEPTFDQYMQNGLVISLVAAIDFTGSNGSPSNPSSLHYTPPGCKSQYMNALHAVIDVLGHLDDDWHVQMYGFGASPSRGKPVSHCFPLNGNMADASVAMKDVYHQYTDSVKAVDFSGPTHATPVIQKVTQDAKAKGLNTKGPLAYTVLLVLTDGDLDDLAATEAACAASAELPISVFFVGIGKCDFNAMAPLRAADGKVAGAKRGNVAFIRMEDYGAGAEARLHAKILAELPSQVETYFTGKGIAPKR